MSIDKKKWQDIAEKYDTKAKWADALLMLNTDDHDDIISALIELDPKDLLPQGVSTIPESVVNTVWTANKLDTTKISVNSVDISLEKSEKALQKAEEALETLDTQLSLILGELDAIHNKLDSANTPPKLDFVGLDPESIADGINKAIKRDLAAEDRRRIFLAQQRTCLRGC